MGLLFSAYAPLALACRLSPGLHPVRPAADARRRAWAMCATSAPATSAPPTCCARATRGSPPPRCCSTCSRARWPCSSSTRSPSATCAFDAYQLVLRRRPRRLPRPPLPGLAPLPRRQGRRHLHRRADRPALAGGRRLLPGVDRRRAVTSRYSSLAALAATSRWCSTTCCSARPACCSFSSCRS